MFHPETKEIIFFTASRGHHADIGGILPGSMPPTSVNIFEEGAEIVSFKIVSGGVFDQKGLYERMIDAPARYPGSSGCRNIRDVESDLKAQIAANHKGAQLIHQSTLFRLLVSLIPDQRSQSSSTMVSRRFKSICCTFVRMPSRLCESSCRP